MRCIAAQPSSIEVDSERRIDDASAQHGAADGEVVRAAPTLSDKIGDSAFLVGGIEQAHMVRGSSAPTDWKVDFFDACTTTLPLRPGSRGPPL